jgi:ribokinase
MFDVITFGSATLDVFLRSKEFEVDTVSGVKDICVRYGAKLEVDEIFFEIGGGATNAAFTFARQGLKTACISQIGKDFSGDKVYKDLTTEGINTDLLDIKKEITTDYGTIIWAGDGGRTVLIYRGNTRLEVGDVLWDKIESRWFYVGSLEGNLEIVERLANRLQTTDYGKITFNPGKRELQQRERLLTLLPKITLLNVNKEEMEQLLQVQSSKLKVQSLLKLAQELPCKYIAITDDLRGSYVWDRDSQQWWHAGIFEDMPRYETTGAGDAYGSGLVTGLIKGLEIKDCLFLAAANASSVVSKVGAKKGILYIDEIGRWKDKKIDITEINV